jgi:Rhs element Vgr protein
LVTAGGQPLAGILTITITKGINRLSEARLELLDGDPSTSAPLQSEADSLAAGAAVEVQAGYDNQHQLLFKGIVVEVAITSQGTQGMLLRVVCKDAAVKLMGGRKATAFPAQAMSDTIGQILDNYPDLSADIASTEGPVENLVQFNRTDWDFIVTQAEANGQLVISDLNKFSTWQLTTAGAPVAAFINGTNLYGFSLRLNARSQFGGVEARSWSAATQQELTATANDPGLTTPGTATSAALAGALGQDTYVIRTAANVSQATLQALADAYLAKRVLAKVQGTVELAGTALVVPGCLISLSGMGSSFDGTGFVAGVTHTIGGGDWKTQATLGTDEQWFAERHLDVAPPAPANNLSTGMHGLYSAVVKATHNDPQGEYRVQVTIATLANAQLWVRLAQPYASAGAGAFFYPEVGDEVLLGFLGDDVSYPVILGSLYSSARTPTYTPDEENSKKAIITKSQLTLEFDDEQKIITLKTPGGNKLVISDEALGLTLTDQQGNTITLSEEGVAIASKTSLSLSANTDITIKALGSITLEAGESLQATALTVSATAEAELTLSSSGTAALTGEAITTVKGALVMIN